MYDGKEAAEASTSTTAATGQLFVEVYDVALKSELGGPVVQYTLDDRRSTRELPSLSARAGMI